MAGDRLAWVEVDGDAVELMFGLPGQARRIRSLPGKWFWLDASPDGQRLLVTVQAAAMAAPLQRWVYEPGSDAWLEVDAQAAAKVRSVESVQWADSDTLAIVGQGFFALRDLDSSAEPAYVIGRP